MSRLVWAIVLCLACGPVGTSSSHATTYDLGSAKADFPHLIEGPQPGADFIPPGTTCHARTGDLERMRQEGFGVFFCFRGEQLAAVVTQTSGTSKAAAAAAQRRFLKGLGVPDYRLDMPSGLLHLEWVLGKEGAILQMGPGNASLIGVHFHLKAVTPWHFFRAPALEHVKTPELVLGGPGGRCPPDVTRTVATVSVNGIGRDVCAGPSIVVRGPSGCGPELVAADIGEHHFCGVPQPPAIRAAFGQQP